MRLWGVLRCDAAKEKTLKKLLERKMICAQMTHKFNLYSPRLGRE